MTPVRFAVDITGRGPAVVFLHDIGSRRGVWDGVVRSLQRYALRLLRYDSRGHGDSSRPNSGYSFLDAALDLETVLRNTGVGTAHLVAAGAGAGAAVSLALRNPFAVHSLTLIAPLVAGWTWSEDWRSELRAVVAAFHNDGEAAGRHAWLNRHRFKEVRVDPLIDGMLAQLLRDWDGHTLWGPPDHAAPAVPDMQRLAEIDVPTQILVGRKDHPELLALARALAGGIKRAELQELDGRGACVELTDPVLVAQAIAHITHAEPRGARAEADAPTPQMLRSGTYYFGDEAQAQEQPEPLDPRVFETFDDIEPI